jgi:hypothetical protein
MTAGGGYGAGGVHDGDEEYSAAGWLVEDGDPWGTQDAPDAVLGTQGKRR